MNAMNILFLEENYSICFGLQYQHKPEQHICLTAAVNSNLCGNLAASVRMK